MPAARSRTAADRPAAPFLKWAGGKGQLLAQFESLWPPPLREGRRIRYVEPFLGGGAVFFHLAEAYGLAGARLYDLNAELVLAYRVVQQRVEPLTERLAALAAAYRRRDAEGRKAYFYEVREAFNRPTRIKRDARRPEDRHVQRAAELIFLNKTCYNGLFRLNAAGAFNVPHGRYKNPRICDADGLRAASRALAVAEIEVADFGAVDPASAAGAFVYFDPPYRPLSATSSFTTYRGRTFDDAEQERLARVFRAFDAAGAYCMLSNSDPRNTDPAADFFERLYGGYDLQRVTASRMINSDAAARGGLTELVIRNYTD